jgi:CheY-like chemotaxis protein
MRSVLIVDDHKPIAEVLAAALRKAGYEAHVAGDGAEALRQLRTLRPCVVVMDLGMPVIDGLQLMQWLKGSEDFRHVPVVAFTAMTGSAATAAHQQGAAAVLQKSDVSLEDVVRCVDRVAPKLAVAA